MYRSFSSGCGLPIILVSAGPSVNPNGYTTVMDHVLKEFQKNLTALHCTGEPKEHSRTCLWTILSPLDAD